MSKRPGKGDMGEKYFALVKSFPLVPIRDDAHLDAASAMLNAVLRMEQTADVEAYLETLTLLVEAYEDEHVKIGPARPGAVLAEMMGQHKLTQSQLSKAVGIAQSTISAIVTGERLPTAGHAVKLGKYFRIGPQAFLPGVA